MRVRKFAYSLLGIGCLMIFSGCVSSFILGLRADQMSVLNRMNMVSDEFEEFSTTVTVFEEQRDLLYKEVLDKLYYDSMYSNDNSVKNKLSNYEAIVNEIDKKTGMLDNLCNEVYYPDSRVNSKCNNYRSIYEQVVNCFVTDINQYNAKVDEYNKSIKLTNGSNVISKYKTNRDFIDYNDDGRFDGKEE